MKRILMMCLSLSLLLGLALPLEGAADKPSAELRSKPKRGGTLTLAITRDMELMNPLVRTRSTEQFIRELMFESLLGIDLKGNLRPNLAESWETSKDGKSYTFRLRRGVKFHNGQEMTAEDAKFAIDYSRNPKNVAYGLPTLALVERAEAADRYTLKVFLKEPNPAFLSGLSEIKAFSVIPKGSLPEGIDKPARFPPGTGPFRFVEWQPNQRIVFERFDDYWGHKTFLDRVVFRPISNATVRFTALRAGDVNMIERTPYEWVKQVLEGKIKGLSFVQAPHGGYRQLTFNVADPPFSNKKLRQAVAHAINRKEILQAVFQGFGEPTDQLYPRGHAWYFDGLQSPSHDESRAQALLKEAGYKGETIEITVTQGAGPETEAVTLQAQLKKIGMNIRLKLLESGAAHDLYKKGEFSFYFGGGGLNTDPSGAYGSQFTCEPDLKRRTVNDSGYCDKEADALIRKAEKEVDPDKRITLFRQIVTKLNEDVPVLPLFFVPRFFAAHDYVKDFTTVGNGTYRWWGGGLNYTWLDR